MSRVMPVSRTPSEIIEKPKRDHDAFFTEQEHYFGNWIHKHGKIKKRECCKYVASTDKKAKLDKDGYPPCRCNKKRTQHKQQNLDLNRWDDNNTEILPTDAFGELQVLGYGQKLAKYIRVDHNQDIKSMLDLMTQLWQLQVPDLIISVTGGAKNFHMKPRLKEVFRRGLMKAAESTGAWIITGGMHAGVMKHVGEAVRDYTVAHGNKSKVVALGIAPWGAVNNRECLTRFPNDGGRYSGGWWPALYKTNQQQRRTSPLDPNHSHFIMVDNGTQNTFGTEIDFRGKLETAISRFHISKSGRSGSSKLIPSVCVVLEGGPGTLKTVKTAIESGTPAVIVEGSGRAADIIAYAYAHSGEEKVEVKDKLQNTVIKTVSVTEDQVWADVEKQIKKEFGDKNIENNMHMIRQCLKKRDHITVFRLDGTYSAKDIDMAILQALLKTNRDVAIEQLKLALAWNRIDVTKSDIFTEESSFEKDDLHDVMFEAILHDKPDFVQLFMENGVVLGEFLTIKRILQLYNNVPHKEVLYQLLRRQKRAEKSKTGFSLKDVSDLISQLMGDFFQPLYSRESRYLAASVDDPNPNSNEGSVEDLDLLIGPEDKDAPWFEPISMVSKNKAGDSHSMISQYSQYQRDMNLDDSDQEFVEPARELFIWCILMNRLDMALLFWDEGKELGIAASLLAQKLLQSIQDQSHDSELKRDLQVSIDKLKTIAVGVLSECYSIDEKKCHMMLVRELHLYGNSTIIELAVEADSKIFIAHAACQSLFNQIWSGAMTTDNSEWTLWGAIFLFPLIPVIIKFSAQERFGSKDKQKKLMIKDEPVRPGLDRRETGHPGLIRQETVMVIPTTTTNGGTKEKFQNNHDKHNKYKTHDSSRSKNRMLPWYMKILQFYNSPIITFRATQISLVIFLVLFSIIILTDFYPVMHYSYVITIKEWVLVIWVFSLFLEEIRQIAIIQASTFRLKLMNYFSDHWNRLDVVTLVLFVVGEILRFIPNNDACFEAARITLALTLMTFCFRLLHTFSVHKELGPKLVMIGKMMVDLLYFVVILLVFVVAYGLCIQAILYPNAELNFELLKDILKKPYFQIYGELFLEEIEAVPWQKNSWGENACTNDASLYSNNTIDRCPTSTATWLVPILMGVYIMITNVLMLNLLIAMFSYTFTHIQNNTEKHWAFQRYYLTKEFHDRPSLAPPLILISHIYMVVRACCQCCCKKCQNVEDAFRKQFDEADVRQIILWESMNVDEYLRRTEAEEQERIENQVKATSCRVDGIAKQVDEIMENSFLMQSNDSAANNPVRLPPALEDRMDYLQQQLERTCKAVDWIVETLVTMGPNKQKPQLQSVEEIREDARKEKEEKRENMKTKLQDMLQKQLQLHQNSRVSRYPNSTQTEPKYRFEVPDEKVPFEEKFDGYNPINFTDRTVLEKTKMGIKYADIDLMLLSVEERKKAISNWNDKDSDCGVDRSTFVDSKYKIIDGLPINPCGRTGMCGRGLLYRFGPNHAGDPIITRWKRDNFGTVVRENSKQVLEFISVQRTDNKEWAIPGGFFKSLTSTARDCLKAELIEEALGGQHVDLTELWETWQEVYRGYADDPRNTDNAWIETICVNYHDEDGSLTQNLSMKAGEGVELVRWQTISSKEQLYGVHLSLLYEVARKRGAAF